MNSKSGTELERVREAKNGLNSATSVASHSSGKGERGIGIGDPRRRKRRTGVCQRRNTKNCQDEAES